MDLLTADHGEIREFLRQKSAHADFELTPGLKPLAGTGCAVLSWNGRKVSIVCLATATKQDLYLFVIDGTDVAGPRPGSPPELAAVNRLTTATWTSAGKAYVLAGPMPAAKLKTYL